jgi:cytidyltransferase-like protein
MPKTVIVSGGFDPLHSGHIAYLQAARNLGDYLVVGVNSDAWLICKKGRAFMPLKERMAVVRALGCVGEVMSFDDSDGTALKLIEAVKAKYPQDEIVFANGGDRTAGNIPEMAAENVAFAFRRRRVGQAQLVVVDFAGVAGTAHGQGLGPLRCPARRPRGQGQGAGCRAGGRAQPAKAHAPSRTLACRRGPSTGARRQQHTFSGRTRLG